jgi:subtilisin family serine protease
MSKAAPPPAWSSQFSRAALRELTALEPFEDLDRAWAWGGSDGSGVRVAIVDSGIEADHPVVAGAVSAGVGVALDFDAEHHVRIAEDDPIVDMYGHGTACAGIIHKLAPGAELYSVRVLGRNLTGKALQFAGGLRWAIENEMDVINLSLSTSRQEYYALFHKLTDQAYFKNVMLVSAANNNPVPSYPSLYSSVISVAAHEGRDPMEYYYNPSPPVEFGAPGINLKVAWLNGGFSTISGNSFAAPHIAALVALIRAKHPDLTPFQIKTVLYACASNYRREQA